MELCHHPGRTAWGQGLPWLRRLLHSRPRAQRGAEDLPAHMVRHWALVRRWQPRRRWRPRAQRHGLAVRPSAIAPPSGHSRDGRKRAETCPGGTTDPRNRRRQPRTQLPANGGRPTPGPGQRGLSPGPPSGGSRVAFANELCSKAACSACAKSVQRALTCCLWAFRG